jgi:peroxiredoxin
MQVFVISCAYKVISDYKTYKQPFELIKRKEFIIQEDGLGQFENISCSKALLEEDA